jgi:serine-type D-Ala-D-Ala carboxypeptidase (penicillin-binding protein 5/6)
MPRASAAAALALLWASAVLAQATDPFAGRAAAYLVRLDGAPLWAAAPDERHSPASLTKLMTALIVDESARADAIVTVSAHAARAVGSRMGLSSGTRITVSGLMAGLLLRSANDACVALAERVAGSEAKFVARMNQRARSLGLADTRFANACGFDAPGHYSSAADLARLADAFLARPALAALVAQPHHVARSVDGKQFRFGNTNALIGRVPGALGVKTGYTGKAGHCLIGLVERDGLRVLVVLLGARDRWWDAVAIIEQAFEVARSRPR